MFCYRCGNEQAEGSAFCSRCGAQLAPPAASVPPEDVSAKSRLAATLLAVFLGWAGAHRFYMGKTASAIIMLLLGLAAWGSNISYIGWSVSVSEHGQAYLDDSASIGILLFALSGLTGVAVGIWALVDFIIAVTGGFHDSQGKPIRKW